MYWYRAKERFLREKIHVFLGWLSQGVRYEGFYCILITRTCNVREGDRDRVCYRFAWIVSCLNMTRLTFTLGSSLLCPFEFKV